MHLLNVLGNGLDETSQGALASDGEDAHLGLSKGKFSFCLKYYFSIPVHQLKMTHIYELTLSAGQKSR